MGSEKGINNFLGDSKMATTTQRGFSRSDIAILDMLGYNGNQREAILEVAKENGWTFAQLLGNAIRHLVGGMIEPDFVGVEASQRLKKLFNAPGDSLS